MVDYNRFRELTGAIHVKQAIDDVKRRDRPEGDDTNDFGFRSDGSESQPKFMRRIPIYTREDQVFAGELINQVNQALTLSHFPAPGTVIRFQSNGQSMAARVTQTDDNRIVVEPIPDDQVENWATASLIELSGFDVHPVPRKLGRLSDRQPRRFRDYSSEWFPVSNIGTWVDFLIIVIVLTVVGLMISFVWLGL